MTDARRWLRVAAVWCATLPLVVHAHAPEPTQKREIVRLQGMVRPDGDAPAGRLTLLALGADHAFAATDRRTFSLGADEPAAPNADRYALQGPREMLARFAAARPDQTVTILAEHHPGSKDLFVLAVDLCPPQ